MGKRNLAEELAQSINEFQEHDAGQRTLRTTEVEMLPPVEMTAADLVALRESLNMSRAVFAATMRANIRSVENWEQGRSKINQTTAALFKLVGQHPENIRHLAAL